MKTIPQRRALTVGDVIAAVYGACGTRRGKETVRPIVHARLITFRGHDRYVIAERPERSPRIA